MKIAIDIGHANGTGARGNGLEEHECCTEIAKELDQMLQGAGHNVTVIDFPEETNRDDLNKTIQAANAGGFDFGISLHCDASDNASARGAHVCFYPGSVQGARLAQAIADPLSKLLPGRSQTTVARNNLAVLKKTKCPWVLCECGFITHVVDQAIIEAQPDWIAKAIAEGVSNFINNQTE